ADKGMPCTAGTGACATVGKLVCSADGTGTVCDAKPGVPGATELCNGLDDNCNGQIDEAFPTLGMDCTVGVGACQRTGKYICAPAQLGVVCDATPGAPGAVEICGNGIDDNCNGAVDEGYEAVGMPCMAGVGACMAFGVFVCGGDGTSIACNAVPGQP